MSERLAKIIEENKRFEKESPYNFCDRWCQRCTHEKQACCRLYLDEFEQKTTCIAHGRDEDDPEITAYVLKKQFEGVGEAIEKFMEENEIDLDESDDPDFQGIEEHIDFVKSNPLDHAAKNYLDKANSFLESTFYKDEPADSGIKYDFETVSWYHTLLYVKLCRALAGFHEPACEGDHAMHDAVAQFETCKKAAAESITALRKIKEHLPAYRVQIATLIALLHNIYSRVEALLESV